MRSRRWGISLCLALGLSLGLASFAGAEPATLTADQGLWFSREDVAKLYQALRDYQQLQAVAALQAQKLEALEAVVAMQQNLLESKDALIQAMAERDALRQQLQATNAREVDTLKAALTRAEHANLAGKLRWGSGGLGGGLLLGLIMALVLL